MKGVWNNPGELTPIGKRMEYISGVYKRYRYINKYKFLSEKYDPHEILIYATDYNRTLSSMTAQLQGLYPMSEKIGDKLKQEQLNISYYPIDINCEDIQNEINSLKDSALPNYMTIIPYTYSNFKG